MQSFIVSNLDLNNGKLRLDSYLSSQLQNSKNQIHHLIKSQKVFLNNTPCLKNGTLLKLNDCIEVDICTAHSQLFTESVHITASMQSIHTAFNPNDERFKIEILYEDSDILIINKPPHLVIHEAPSVKEPTLTDWLKANAHILHTLSGEERYGIIHRLDKQTSGALAIAKSSLAYTTLPKDLKERQMGRYYLAIIDTPLKSNQRVQCYMGRNPHNRLKMSKIHIRDENAIPKGVRDSKSTFIKLATSNNGHCELIAIKLHTGRTHQIRAHLESLSRHILGDTLYGYKSHINTYHYKERILLHAYILYLNHPRSKQNHIFKAPIFRDMLEFIQTHFTKDIPNDCQNIMQLLETDRVMRVFECFS
ncbi:RluA family pseudouridine synthase [Helicobacter mastomyrinus]|uniref:RNA pseudouridylate synthase n=4 Tax=Helicobacter TaxID=209 RepID=A0ABZ3F671_9HELI|nr:RluA family pseudouridine synthase [uncultured Helicobacter sp.]